MREGGREEGGGREGGRRERGREGGRREGGREEGEREGGGKEEGRKSMRGRHGRLTLADVGGDLHLEGCVLVGEVAEKRDQLRKNIAYL